MGHSHFDDLRSEQAERDGLLLVEHQRIAGARGSVDGRQDLCFKLLGPQTRRRRRGRDQLGDSGSSRAQRSTVMICKCRSSRRFNTRPPRDVGTHTHLESLRVGLQGEMFGKQCFDRLEDGHEGHTIRVEQTATLHQVQTGGETGQPVHTHTLLK